MEGKLTVDSLLLVRPCVQELAKGKPVVVPPRYLQPDQDPPHVKLSRSSTDQDVPVIDMQLLLSGDNSVADSELQKLDLACKDWGFFQLINHGVSTSLVEKVKAETREFFDMPMEEKKKFWQEAGEVQGYGQAFVFSEDQKLDWADMFYMITLPRNIRLPHLFPQLPLPFRDTLDTYSQELYGLGMKIVMQMAKALTMEAEEMRLLFEGGMQAIRMNYYPPCPQPEHVIGLTPHSDPQGLTILLQLNETDGLQIKKDDRWLPIKPLPNAFIINVGNVLEMVSNGTYPSIEHRATINSEKERLSIATFLSPKLEDSIGPAPSLISPETPPLFKTIGFADYLRGFLSRELNGKSYLDAMRVQEDDAKI